ncbi:hypothetical protein [Hoeflea phototrophica]|jgi:hypothetical protein|uniref:hypothetical protein n=1 Tax=Hoeflea phototrophica TaxID=244596 RepID=UPI0001616250|nr:hypothetical protein [Hoeflea phototrophica]
MTPQSTIQQHGHSALRPAKAAVPFVVGGLALAAAAVLTGLVFAAWTSNGPALFHALAASGLAWCL